MREMGLEPTRSYNHKILSLACLPIPALPHNESYLTIFRKNCQCFLKNIYKKQFENNWKNILTEVGLYTIIAIVVAKDNNEMQKWRNWQTRTVQVRVVAIP